MKHQLAINISSAAKCLADMSFFDKVEFVKSCGVDAIELHPYKEWPAAEGTVLRGLSPGCSDWSGTPSRSDMADMDAARSGQRTESEAIPLHSQSGGQDGRGPSPFHGLADTEAARVRNCCRGLRAVSVHALMGQTFSSDDPVLRDEAIAGDKLAIRQAAFLGSRAVVVHCRMKQIDEPEVFERVKPGLLDLAEHGDVFGVRVCLETPTDLRDPAHFLSLFERIPHANLGATIDTGQLLNCLDDQTKQSPRVVDAYNDLLFDLTRAVLDMGKLFHVHLNDVRAHTLADHYGMGLGFVDFGRVIGEMKRHGYDGLLAMEIHRGPDDEVGSLSPEGFRKAVAYVKGVVGA